MLSSVMVVSSVIPWLDFLFSYLPAEKLPLRPVAAVYLLPLCLFMFFRSGSMRRIIPLTAYASAYFLSLFFIFSRYSGIDLSLPPGPFISQFFLPEKTVPSFLTALLLHTAVAWLWIEASGACSLAAGDKKADHYFDRGGAFFLALFLVKLLVRLKGAPLSAGATAIPWFITFFTAGISFLFISRRGFSSGRETPGRESDTSDSVRKIFIVALFLFSVIFLVFSATLLFYPEMKEIAEAGSGVLEQNTAWLERGVIFLLRFFLDYNYRNQLAEASNSDSSSDIAIPATDFEKGDLIFYYIFLAIVTIIAAALIIAALVFLAMKTARWLFAKKSNDKSNKEWGLKEMLKALASFLSKMFFSIRRKGGSNRADEYFRKLSSWGRLAGVAKRYSETPKEYTDRLSVRFPYLKNEFRELSFLYEQYFYGNIHPEREQYAAARQSLIRIKNPASHIRRKKGVAHPAE